MRERDPLPPIAPPRFGDDDWRGTPPGLGEFAPGAGLRDVAGWIAAALLALALAGWIAALSAAQATSEEAALPALERAVAVLAEIDGLLGVHAAAVAGEAARGGEVALPGFPLDVRAPAAEAASPRRLRAALLAEAAALVRAEGSAAFRDEDGDAPSVPRLTSAGLMRELLDGLAASGHERWSGYVTPLGALSALLAAVALLLAVGLGRFVRLGAVAIAAAALVLAPTAALWFGLGFVGGDDAVGEEARALARALLGGVFRNALWLAGAGLAVAVPAAILDRVFEDSPRLARAPRAPDAGEEPAAPDR